MRSEFEDVKRFAIADILSASGRRKTTETIDKHINTIIDIALLKGQHDNKTEERLEVTMPLEVAQASLDAMKKVFMDWDVLNENPPEFLKHMQDLAYYVEQVGGEIYEKK